MGQTTRLWTDQPHPERIGRGLWAARGQGVALRCGRVSFQYGLREFGEQGSTTMLEFRLLPFNTRLQIGAELLARTLTENTGYKMQVSDEGERLIWSV